MCRDVCYDVLTVLNIGVCVMTYVSVFLLTVQCAIVCLHMQICTQMGEYTPV